METDLFLACCLHPTTVVLIDDDKRLLEFVELRLKRKIPCTLYSEPIKALKFLEEEYRQNPFTKRCLIHPEDSNRGHRNIDVDLSAVPLEIYNPNRFEEIAVVVVDYAMPSIDDPKELCQKIKSKGFKVILLTGEADEKIALQLFNERAINQFIRKDTPDFVDILIVAIQALQKAYFKGLSKIVIDSLTQDPDALPSCLIDPIFIRFFQNFVKQHEFVEYYLYEPTGSFLFLDGNAQPSWLLVKDEDEMSGALFDAETNDIDAPEEVIHALTTREKLLHRFKDEDITRRLQNGMI